MSLGLIDLSAGYDYKIIIAKTKALFNLSYRSRIRSPLHFIIIGAHDQKPTLLLRQPIILLKKIDTSRENTPKALSIGERKLSLMTPNDSMEDMKRNPIGSAVRIVGMAVNEEFDIRMRLNIVDDNRHVAKLATVTKNNIRRSRFNRPFSTNIMAESL